MLLLTGPAPEFLRFIQVLCWIIIPVLSGAVAVIIFLHYRKKKNGPDENAEILEGKLLESVSGLMGYTNGNGEYIVFDNSVLIRQYKNTLSYNQARYTALQHDFAKMETKYNELALYARNLFVKPKKEFMGNAHEIPKHVQADINRLAEDHAAEKKELQDKLAQLERSCRQLEQENKALQEQLKLGTATEDGKAAIINKWKEENTSLRDKVADQEYLQDLVEEKKAQVGFLQNQLEQRIKNLYQSEHQRLQAVAEMKQAKEDKESINRDMEVLKNELLLKQEQADKAQIVLCEREEQLTEKQRTLNEKSDHIAQLENRLRETRQQSEQLNNSVLDIEGRANSLQQELTSEQSKVQFLTQKLFANKQTLRRLHKEFSTFLEESGEEPPIILLKPEFNGNGHEEMVMQ